MTSDGGSFNDHLKNTMLHASSTEEMTREIENRNKQINPFPLDVFNSKIKPFLNSLVTQYDIPKSYVGLAMLAAYSTAIGSAFRVSINRRNNISLAIWACLEGISSSGKSLAIDMTHQPLYDIQDEFDRTWDEKSQGISREKLLYEKLETTIYRDAHIPTLVRYVLPDNPKGVAKHSDEIMEWLNGMNQLSKKEGTDEQFWLSTWNGRGYSGLRSGKEKFVIPRPFVNVIGGIQPTITYKLFAKDRDTTGFIFRLLFAVPEEVRIASPSHSFILDDSIEMVHKKSIRKMYTELPVYDAYDEPRLCVVNRKAVHIFYQWEERKKQIINAMDNIRDKEIHSGVLGKIKEYTLRFAALLQLADRAYEEEVFWAEETIEPEVMTRACALGDYFYDSAVEVYDRVNQSMTAPAEILQVAALIRSGYSFEKIAESFYKGKIKRQTVHRRVKKWILEYPKVFNAVAR